MEREEFNLFPLILGLVLAAGGAFAWYVSSTPRAGATQAASSSPKVVPVPAVVETPLAASLPLAPGAAPPALPPVVAMTAPPASAAVAPAGGARIWQCDINGQRVFADYPCSKDAKPREVSEVNGMEATPVPARRYGYAPPAPDYTEPYYESGGAETASTVYVPYPFAYAVRAHPPHPHHPQAHAAARHY